MPESFELAVQALDRIMKLKEFTVNVPVSDSWTSNGTVPFDVKIKDGIATVTVPALNEQEAIDKANKYFNNSV